MVHYVTLFFQSADNIITISRLNQAEVSSIISKNSDQVTARDALFKGGETLKLGDEIQTKHIVNASLYGGIDFINPRCSLRVSLDA